MCDHHKKMTAFMYILICSVCVRAQGLINIVRNWSFQCHDKSLLNSTEKTEVVSVPLACASLLPSWCLSSCLARSAVWTCPGSCSVSDWRTGCWASPYEGCFSGQLGDKIPTWSICEPAPGRSLAACDATPGEKHDGLCWTHSSLCYVVGKTGDRCWKETL